MQHSAVTAIRQSASSSSKVRRTYVHVVLNQGFNSNSVKTARRPELHEGLAAARGCWQPGRNHDS